MNTKGKKETLFKIMLVRTKDSGPSTSSHNGRFRRIESCERCYMNNYSNTSQQINSWQKSETLLKHKLKRRCLRNGCILGR